MWDVSADSPILNESHRDQKKSHQLASDLSAVNGRHCCYVLSRASRYSLYMLNCVIFLLSVYGIDKLTALCFEVQNVLQNGVRELLMMDHCLNDEKTGS